MNISDKRIFFQILKNKFDFDPKSWSDQQILQFLEFTNLQYLIPIFQRKKVNGLELMTHVCEVKKKDLQHIFKIDNYVVIKKLSLWLDILVDYNKFLEYEEDIQQKVTNAKKQQSQVDNEVIQQQQKDQLEKGMQTIIQQDQFCQQKNLQSRNKSKVIKINRSCLEKIKAFSDQNNFEFILLWSSENLVQLFKHLNKSELMQVVKKYQIDAFTFIILLKSFTQKQISDSIGPDYYEIDKIQEICDILISFKFWEENNYKMRFESIAKPVKQTEEDQEYQQRIIAYTDMVNSQTTDNPGAGNEENKIDGENQTQMNDSITEQSSEALNEEQTQRAFQNEKDKENPYLDTQNDLLSPCKKQQDNDFDFISMETLMENQGGREKLTGSQLLQAMAEKAKMTMLEKEQELDQKIQERNRSRIRERSNNSFIKQLQLEQALQQENQDQEQQQQEQHNNENNQEKPTQDLGTSEFMLVEEDQVYKNSSKLIERPQFIEQQQQLDQQQNQNNNNNQLGTSECFFDAPPSQQQQQQQSSNLGTSEIIDIPQQTQQQQQPPQNNNQLGSSEIMIDNSAQFQNNNNNLGTSQNLGQSLYMPQEQQQQQQQNNQIQQQQQQQNSDLGSSEIFIAQNDEQVQSRGQSIILTDPEQINKLTNGVPSNKSNEFNQQINKQNNNNIISVNLASQKQGNSEAYQQYLQRISDLEKESFSLPFNPFDFKNVNSMKIRIKSMNGTYNREKNIHMDGASFGRQRDNSISFEREGTISKHHSRIIFENDQFYIQDVASNFGTYIKIQDVFEIKQNMIIQFGNKADVLIEQLQANGDEGIMNLQFQKPMNSLQVITIKQGKQIKIGRDEEKCQITIQDPHQIISKEHAVLTYKNNKFYLQDLQSLNGTWLRLSQKSQQSELYPLKNNTKIKLASAIRIEIQSINILNMNQ